MPYDDLKTVRSRTIHLTLSIRVVAFLCKPQTHLENVQSPRSPSFAPWNLTTTVKIAIHISYLRSFMVFDHLEHSRNHIRQLGVVPNWNFRTACIQTGMPHKMILNRHYLAQGEGNHRPTSSLVASRISRH